MKALVYHALSQNNVLTKMSASLAVELERRQVRSELLSFEGEEWAQRLVKTLAEGSFDYVVVFSSFGAELRLLDGRSIYDAAGCGFVGWDVDHPAYQFRRYTPPLARRIQVCASQSHFDFARRIGGRAVECLMLPGVDAVAQDPRPLADRPIMATVAMSWLGEPETWWSGAKGTAGYSLIQGMVDRLLADEGVDLLAAFDATTADLAMELPFDENTCGILANIGYFIRRYDRLKLAQALARSDLPLVLCGEGWRDRLGDRPHLTYRGNLDFADDVRALYADSRVVLNLNAANGASERAILAMASGAAVLSDFSPLVQSEFEARGGLRFFDRRDPPSVAAAIGDLLASPDAQAVADRGRDLVSRGHLWSHKALRLADEMRRLAGGGEAAA